MGSGDTNYSTAQSGASAGPFHTALASGAGGAGSGSTGGGLPGSSEQSVSLAPRAWEARAFGWTGEGVAQHAVPQAIAEGEEEGLDVELSDSSVVIRAAVPPALLSDTAGTPLAQALHLVGPASQHGSPSRSPVPAARGGAATASPPPPPAWEFPRPAAAALEAPTFLPPPAARSLPFQQPAAAASPLRFQQATAGQQQPQPQLPPWQQQQRQQQAPAWPRPPQRAGDQYTPAPATQQPLPPGRYGWQRNPHMPEPESSADSDPLSGLPSGKAGMQAPSAPSAAGSRDSWLSSLAASSEAPAGGMAATAGGAAAAAAAQQQGPDAPFRPPSAASAVMLRGPSSQQQLLPAEAAIYGGAELGVPGSGALGSGADGRGLHRMPTDKSSPGKASLASSSAAFHVEAYAGSAAAGGAGGGAAGAGQPGARPSRQGCCVECTAQARAHAGCIGSRLLCPGSASCQPNAHSCACPLARTSQRFACCRRCCRTAALRRRHARQLRRVDRDQYGVPVASSARPFSLWASPLHIGEACTGEGGTLGAPAALLVSNIMMHHLAVTAPVLPVEHLLVRVPPWRPVLLAQHACVPS